MIGESSQIRMHSRINNPMSFHSACGTYKCALDIFLTQTYVQVTSRRNLREGMKH